MIKGFLAFLLTVICLAGFAQEGTPVCGPFAQFYNKDSINIVTFGASTVEGVPAPLSFQRPLKGFIERCYVGKPVTIANNGVAGETTSDGLKRFDAAMAGKNGFFLILMGVNDAFQIADGKARISTTLSNMREMITRAKNNKFSVILGTLQYSIEPPGKTPEARLAQRRNRVIDEINAGYRKLAKEMDVRIADFNSVIGKNKNLYSDGLHPNSRGYQVLAFVFFDALNQEISERFQYVDVLQNYPNPANAFTRLRYNLSIASPIKVSLYNSVGQRVAVVIDGYRNSGYHEEEISTLAYSPGIYFLRFELTNLKFTKKMIVVH